MRKVSVHKHVGLGSIAGIYGDLHISVVPATPVPAPSGYLVMGPDATY